MVEEVGKPDTTSTTMVEQSVTSDTSTTDIGLPQPTEKSNTPTKIQKKTKILQKNDD